MNIHNLTSQPSDERSFLGSNSLTPGAAGGFHGPFGGLSNGHSMPVPSRSISPGSSFGGGSIAGSAVSDVPPLLPLFPIHKPLDHTMPWNPAQAAAERQRMRPYDSRAAYSEGVPQRAPGWNVGVAHPLSQSHNDRGFVGGRFDPTREASRSPTSDPIGKPRVYYQKGSARRHTRIRYHETTTMIRCFEKLLLES
ncbi:hypothetical protein BJ508DRAFT_143472 [Ascobolus immersus RN42]|uniref:Uncharacterized protein n=1 Tax=Ascobolus immersus RN42 TaxID=1160509 RepID=A0A3N4IC29_ASCIM|nr:hypothetical protein BJ508DRAFT_143472 [Ascobolus immersus RN42]